MRIYFAGGGRCAEYVARRLIREGHDLVLLDHDAGRCRHLGENLDARIVHGDASSIEDWRRAGLEDADMFTACTGVDAINVMACMIANDIAPTALKAIRLRTPEHRQWRETLDRLGLRVDRVVHPESDMVNRIKRVITVRGVTDIRNFADDRVNLFSLNLAADNDLVGTPVDDFPKLMGVGEAQIGVIFRANQAIIPGPGDRLAAGDQIYVVTCSESLNRSLELLGLGGAPQVRQVFIVGGGEVGLELARALEQDRIPVKLFEQDAERCDYLAGELHSSIVINDDGTSQDVLLQEGIEGIDAFIALTGDEDANLIACLLARRLHVDKVVPLVTSINYLELAQLLGINTTVNPRIKAADALFEFVRKGGVLSVRSLGEDTVEAIELAVPESSVYIDRPLGDIDLPAGTRVGAIVRPNGTVFIPDSSTSIGAGDRVVLFTNKGAVRELERKILVGE